MNIILFDHNRESFFPLTFTRPIADLRIGVVTIKEKWEHYFDRISIKTERYLSEKFPINQEEENLWINAQALPNQDLVYDINKLKAGDVLFHDKIPIAFIAAEFDLEHLNKKEIT
ncbi:MAG: putative sugar nucleotidyl transferase, partial [Bacteroidota bacterium]|nr:putative sugar nucleotidyl transferase [Bacteroidota bacterium]